MRVSFVAIATLIASINALTITSPSQNQVVDPTSDITVTWSSDSSDPATINLLASGSLLANKQVGSDVSTASGSFVIPGNTLQSYGIGFVIKAESSDGSVLATSSSFTLSVSAPSSIGAQSGVVQASTVTTGAANTDSSATADSASQTISTAATSSTGMSSEETMVSGTRTGFSTSTMSGTSRSTTRSASSTSASSAATTSANAQPRLASGSQIVLSGAGLLAGLAALLA